MATLTGQTVASTYPILLKIESAPMGMVFKTVEAGDGTDSALQLATTGIKSQGTIESTGAATVGGTITVTGSSILNGGAVVTGAVTVSTTLGVTGVLTATGGVVGALTGAVTGNTAGTHTGAVTGNVTGNTAGVHTGAVIGNVTGNTAGVHTGAVTGNVTGDVTGNVTGNTAGTHTGAVTGNVTGNTAGVHTGAVTGNVTGDTAGVHTGAVTGNVTGNATTAAALQTSRSITLAGAVTGSANFDGSANISITTSGGGTITSVSDQANTSTGYLDLPVGTTAQRPASPASGNSRYNTTIPALEYYTGSAWESAATAASTLTQFGAGGSAPVFACRAWVNFNGTGTVAINASGNVSSITDNGVGDYTANFTTAMQDTSYAVNGHHCATDSYRGGMLVVGNQTSVGGTQTAAVEGATQLAGSVRFQSIHSVVGSTPIDSASIRLSIFR